MKSTMTCRVTRGELNNDDAIALAMALDDLRVYWEKAFGTGSFLLADEQPERKADLDLLVGAAENLPAIAALVKQGKIEAVQIPEQGFALDIVASGKRRTAVLCAADRLGLQYAVYGFAEQFLGVRFVHPLLDLQPEKPPMPKELRLVETPARPLRVLTEGSHVRPGLRGTEGRQAHYSDVGAWRWEDWAGYPERTRHFLAWSIKNRANIVVFDDTPSVCAKANLKPFSISDSLWQYMDARGLKTIMWCGPGYTWEAPAGAYNPDDYCNHSAPRVGPWDRHLCVNKPGFWKEADDWLEILAPQAHRLAALFTNWQENVCGEGVTEGHEDGVIHRHGASPYDMNSAYFRKPMLSKGGGCAGCGHLDNVDKWVKHIEYLAPRTVARGLPPIGITRTFWGVAEPDDGMVAERVVPHLPEGSVNFVACLPGCHRAERVEAWPRIMDAVNRADKGGRKIMLYRELQYGCESDFPIVPFTNLDRIDDDYRVFGRYESFAALMGGVYAFHSLGWMFPLYSMRKQWQPGSDWKAWFRTYFRGLLPERFIETFLEIATLLQSVQMLDGLQDGEFSGSYYSFWGLDLHRLAPEALPRDGGLKALWRDEARLQYLRLVKAGAADGDGVYTTERCAPAARRLAALRAKLEQALEKIPVLQGNLPATAEGGAWYELALLPLRWTARFLQSRVLLTQSCLAYIRLREEALAGRNTAAEAAEGLALCQQALAAQDEYIRQRPGFCICDYPKEINPATLRNLIAAWRRLAQEPGLARDCDICALLDRAETATEAP